MRDGLHAAADADHIPLALQDLEIAPQRHARHLGVPELKLGKRHLARAVHARSRRDGQLVALRAGGLRPDELAAAIDRAARGSLLLADIDDASPDLQARLLHALDQPRVFKE